MSHVRQQIREAAATAVTGLTTSGARVFQSRTRPIADGSLPCLLVNTDDETVEVLTVDGLVLDRRLTLSISAYAKATSSLDDTLDTMIAEVETVLGNTTLSGKVKSLALQSVRIEMEQGEKPAGRAVMQFEANYMTVANAPSTAI